MRIYFTRHGESEANLLHEISNRGLCYGLTLKGCEQANVLSNQLKGIQFIRIYSSPLLRAVETSAILANLLNVEYEVTNALREYDCGILEGRSDDQAWLTWKELFDAWTLQQDWHRCIEGGESFHDLRNRFEPFIQGLVNCYGDTSSNVVCVGHGGVYRMMLPVILKNVDTDMFRKFGFDYTGYMVAETRSPGLFCIEWNGQLIEG